MSIALLVACYGLFRILEAVSSKRLNPIGNACVLAGALIETVAMRAFISEQKKR
jgi:hypothetical protein